MGCGTSSHSVNSTAFSNDRPLNTPDSSNRPACINYTSADFIRCRNDFWESRVEGDSMMWVSIRSACDALLKNDTALAQAILEVLNELSYY